jgi:hypothetical protein
MKKKEKIGKLKKKKFEKKTKKKRKKGKVSKKNKKKKTKRKAPWITVVIHSVLCVGGTVIPPHHLKYVVIAAHHGNTVYVKRNYVKLIICLT